MPSSESKGLSCRRLADSDRRTPRTRTDSSTQPGGISPSYSSSRESTRGCRGDLSTPPGKGFFFAGSWANKPTLCTLSPTVPSGGVTAAERGRGPWGRGTRRVRAGCTAHESSAPGPRGDDSFTKSRPVKFRACGYGRTRSFIINKCFKGHTPGARNVSTQTERRRGNGAFGTRPGVRVGGERRRVRQRPPDPLDPRSPPARRQLTGARQRWVALAEGRRALADAPPFLLVKHLCC